jgi:TolB-like protein
MDRVILKYSLNTLWVALVFATVIVGIGAIGSRAVFAADDPFDAFAKELISTIERNTVSILAPPSLISDPAADTDSAPSSVLKIVGPGTSEAPEFSIDVWPFRTEDIPVPKTTADRWNEKLVAALIRLKPDHMRIITRQHLKTLLLETQTIGAFETVVNPAETLARNATVSTLIIGEMRAAAEGVELGYKGVDVRSGTLVAATGYNLFPLDLGIAESRERTLPLSAAISHAAKAIADRGLDIQTLEIFGLRQEPGKQVPPFSDYFANRLAAKLEHQISATQLDFRLKVSDATFTEASLTTRGIPITGTAEAAAGSGANSGDRDARSSFKLGGSFWVFSKHVDVTLVLQNSIGERATWTGRIDRTSIPQELFPAPEDDAAVNQTAPWNDIGPIGLEISTNKGRNPRFRLGETMELWVKVQNDAYLNCYYHQADGTALRFFPNHFMRTGNQIKADQVTQLPGKDMPFSFIMSPPEGSESIHCFATDRPVAADLPDTLGAQDLKPIPEADYRKLSETFRALPGIRISESSLTVTVRD